MSKIIIIGGGAAGMMAALAASGNGNKVCLYEKNEKTGKKLYITGKGRCNVTNASDLEQVFKSIISNPKFMYSAFYTMTNDMTMDMFQSELGIALKVERGNRVFPESDKSSDIIAGLLRAMKKRNVEIHLNTEVKELITENNIIRGVRLHDGATDNGDSVIVATGGFSYQATGSTGDGYRWAKKTGHNVTDIFPALVPLEVKEEYAAELQGLSLKNVKVSIIKNNKVLYSDFGEMLFTHFGISGPVILSGSSYIVKSIKKGEKINISIDLKPAISNDTLDARILREFGEASNKDFRNSLGNLLPKSLIPVIIKLSGINQFKKVNEVTKEERKRLVGLIKAFPLTVKDTRGFNEAIITQGGVSVKDINPATMESKHIKGLFFAGEVIDVDALTGGYNLQIAWSTGWLAGQSAAGQRRL